MVIHIHICTISDQLLEDVCPAHARCVVDGSAAMVPAAIGVSSSFQQDLGTLEVPVDHSHVEGGLPLHIHQVDLSPFLEEEVDTGAMASGGGNAQRSAGQPAAAPHRLFIDPALEALLLQQALQRGQIPHVGCIV